MGKKQGWQCPECERIYAPTVEECKHCNEARIEKVRVIRETEYIYIRTPYIPDLEPYHVYPPIIIPYPTIAPRWEWTPPITTISTTEANTINIATTSYRAD